MYRSNGGDLFRYFCIRHDSGKDDGILAARDIDSLARKTRAQLSLDLTEIGLHSDIEGRHKVAMPDHDAGMSRGFAVENDFVRGDDHGICDGRIGDSNPGRLFVELCELSPA